MAGLQGGEAQARRAAGSTVLCHSGDCGCVGQLDSRDNAADWGLEPLTPPLQFWRLVSRSRCGQVVPPKASLLGVQMLASPPVSPRPSLCVRVPVSPSQGRLLD